MFPEEISVPAMKHIELLQAIIARMAESSRGCKQWGISLAAALVALAGSVDESSAALAAVLPILVFGLLDAYYLGQEKMFRDKHKEFVDKLITGRLKPEDYFDFSLSVPWHTKLCSTLHGCCSFSVWGPYTAGLASGLVAYFIMRKS